jgi:hypothetical protein
MVLGTSPAITDSLRINGVDNVDSLAIYNTGATKYVVVKPETSTDVSQIGYWTGASFGTLELPGSLRANAVSLSGQLTSTLANSTATGGGQIYLNGATGNRIDWNINGVAVPAFTTRSAGTKLVLYPSISSSSVDYGFGIESGTLWSSVATTGSLFKWYGGTTLAASLTGAGVLTTVSHILPTVNNTQNLGSASFAWATVYGTTFSGTASQAKYADLSENYLSDNDYAAGTVVIFGGSEEITISTSAYLTSVAGVISKKPAYLMNSDLENGLAVALTGRVPVKVIGKINKGDLIVSSDIPGVAMAVPAGYIAPIGSILGKSLANYDSDEIGLIEVVIGVR